MAAWTDDLLGAPYEHHVIDLGTDPDGEGHITATLVRRRWTRSTPPKAAVLYVHGFTDYFFQKEMAEFYVKRGIAFYALDLRKCGRSLGDGHTAHYVSTLDHYAVELEQALAIVREETDAPVLLSAHSTGGLIVPLWLDRLNRTPGGTRGAGIVGLILNSPWFDMQGPALLRTVGTPLIRAVSLVLPKERIRMPPAEAYGKSLVSSGEWDYDVALKPLAGFPVTFGWLSAIRRGHRRLQRGLDIGVPSLVLRSTKSRIVLKYGPEVDTADAVLDVKQIARWAGCLGDAVTSVPIEGARHDVFLSLPEPRKAAYAEVDRWVKGVLA